MKCINILLRVWALKGGATGDKQIHIYYHLNYDLGYNLFDCVGRKKVSITNVAYYAQFNDLVSHC